MLQTCGVMEEGRVYSVPLPLAKRMLRENKAVLRSHLVSDPMTKTMKRGQVALRGGIDGN
jgi:hypothetical protein